MQKCTKASSMPFSGEKKLLKRGQPRLQPLLQLGG